jgi:hypothetical protein
MVFHNKTTSQFIALSAVLLMMEENSRNTYGSCGSFLINSHKDTCVDSGRTNFDIANVTRSSEKRCVIYVVFSVCVCVCVCVCV